MSALHPDFDDTLLSRDPLLFFGLDAAWAAADLKRAYTTLLRRWKPEKFPEEFKRLRAAYDRLRESSGASRPIAAPSPTPAANAAPESAPPPAASSLREKRPASAILREETKEEALRILSGRGLFIRSDALALARLRAANEEVWPHYCLRTLAQSLVVDRGDTDLSPLFATVESVVAGAPTEDFRTTLDAFAPFEEVGDCYFDITADLWIEFSKRDCDACLMRLDRLLHFSATGRRARHAYFLLRFCIAGACRLPVAWLRRQSAHLGSLQGFPGSATPVSGRLASHGPLGACARHVSHELDFLEALIVLREDLESSELAKNPMAERYRELVRAYLDRDAETCLREWSYLAGRTRNTFAPWRQGPHAAYCVMGRIRETLDPMLTLSRAPAVPKGGYLAMGVAVSLYAVCLLVISLGAFALLPVLLGALLGLLGSSGLMVDSFRSHDWSFFLKCVLTCGISAVILASAVYWYFGRNGRIVPRIKSWFAAKMLGLRRFILWPVLSAVRRGDMNMEGVNRRLFGDDRSFLKPLRHDDWLIFRITVFQGTKS